MEGARQVSLKRLCRQIRWWYNLSSSGSSSFPSASVLQSFSGRTLVPESPDLCPKEHHGWTSGRYPNALTALAGCYWWRGAEAPRCLVSHYFCHHALLLTVGVNNGVFRWESPLALVLPRLPRTGRKSPLAVSIAEIQNSVPTASRSAATQQAWGEVL